MTRRSTEGDPWAVIRKLESRIAKLESAAPINRATVSRGALRVKSVEGLVVEGSAKVVGQLSGSGTLTWTGPANLNGNTIIGGTLQVTSSATIGGITTINGTLTVNATTNLGGNTTISGTLSITGNVTISGTLNVSGAMTVTNNLTVSGGGNIKAGNVTVSPASGGRVQVGPLTLNADGTLSHSTEAVKVTTGLTVDGATWLNGAVRVNGISSTNGGQTPNVWIDAQGFLRRIPS